MITTLYRYDYCEYLMRNKATGVEFTIMSSCTENKADQMDQAIETLYSGYKLPEGVKNPDGSIPEDGYEIISSRPTGDYFELMVDGTEVEHYPYLESLPKVPEGFDELVRLK